MSQWAKISQMQETLDLKILKKFNLKSENTVVERILALMTEVSELANETRCFKYWSTKGKSDLPIILEEYVDGIHFLVSLGNELNYDFNSTDFFSLVSKSKKTTTEMFIKMFIDIADLKENFNKKTFEKIFINYLGLGIQLTLTEEQIIEFYIRKNKKNHDRQKNNY